MPAAFDRPLIDAVTQLIDAGCHYRLEALAQCYAPDLEIVIVQEDGAVATFDYEQNMAFFRQRREAGAAPLNTAVEFNHARQHSGIGHVIATRYMDWGGGEKKIVFTILLRQEPAARAGGMASILRAGRGGGRCVRLRGACDAACASRD